MAPFTSALGFRYWPVGSSVKDVGPAYAGSASLLAFGWVIVLLGHWTRNDCAPAGDASRTNRTAGKPRELHSCLSMCDLLLLGSSTSSSLRCMTFGPHSP